MGERVIGEEVEKKIEEELIEKNFEENGRQDGNVKEIKEVDEK